MYLWSLHRNWVVIWVEFYTVRVTVQCWQYTGLLQPLGDLRRVLGWIAVIMLEDWTTRRWFGDLIYITQGRAGYGLRRDFLFLAFFWHSGRFIAWGYVRLLALLIHAMLRWGLHTLWWLAMQSWELFRRLLLGSSAQLWTNHCVHRKAFWLDRLDLLTGCVRRKG